MPVRVDVVELTLLEMEQFGIIAVRQEMMALRCVGCDARGMQASHRAYSQTKANKQCLIA